MFVIKKKEWAAVNNPLLSIPLRARTTAAICALS